ncbi:MAG TPA: hypothetical protein VJ780_05835 [Flavobacterium sp.]|uniref:hypothetical protein n=1 Tax=Flavobacterium sp. HNIBRBA15423 TaxID=3458683 RepID=UPI002CC631C3|nr:hypothetical protein [Flavobacterium sp.]
MKVIIETEEQYKNMLVAIANAIHAKISFNDEELFSNLPNKVKESIIESQEQVKNGEVFSHDEVMQKYIAKYQ